MGSGQKVPVISASEDTLIHNIKRVVEAHPRVRTIYLTDDDFCIVKKSVIRFCEKIIKEKENGEIPKISLSWHSVEQAMPLKKSLSG